MKTEGPAALPRSLARQLPLYLDLIRWNRPAGWLLLLWPTLSALWIAANGFPGWHLLTVFTLGTFLMRSAGCCLNDVADREFDKHVKRTAQRPVTRGALSVKEALLFGAVLALLAFALVLTTNAVAIAWSFAALVIALAYPYAKRLVSMPQAVLGVAFSFGIPMAFAAVQSQVPLLAWILLLGNLFWVVAYDTEYAMVDRDDDLKIGIRTSAITLGRADVPVVMLSAGCCLNDVADREFDKHVKRTAQRPVTRGALSVKEALLFGAVLALLAFALVLTTNAVAIAWSFAALAIALAYPYAKRLVSMPQAVLGVAFSFGIPMAFAAVQSQVPLLAWILLLGNLFWVVAYDTEYAMVDRDDDLKIGIRTSAITLGRADVPVVMLSYAIYLAVWTVVLVQRVASPLLLLAIALAAAQALWHYALIRGRTREGCFKAFRLNHWLGFTVFAGVVAGHALR